MTFVCNMIIKVSSNVYFLHVYVLEIVLQKGNIFVYARDFFRFQVFRLSHIK